MTMFPKCPRCGQNQHDGPCLFEDPTMAATHDELIAARDEIKQLRDERLRLRMLLHIAIQHHDDTLHGDGVPTEAHDEWRRQAGQELSVKPIPSGDDLNKVGMASTVPSVCEGKTDE